MRSQPVRRAFFRFHFLSCVQLLKRKKETKPITVRSDAIISYLYTDYSMEFDRLYSLELGFSGFHNVFGWVSSGFDWFLTMCGVN